MKNDNKGKSDASEIYTSLLAEIFILDKNLSLSLDSSYNWDFGEFYLSDIVHSVLMFFSTYYFKSLFSMELSQSYLMASE